MIKKIILIITPFLIIFGLVFYLDYQKYRSINIKLSSYVESVKIFPAPAKGSQVKDGSEIMTVSSSGVVRLKMGEYTYITSGDKIVNYPTNFTVSNNMDLSISPNFSKSYLSTLGPEIIPVLTELLTELHPDAMTKFDVNNFILLKNADWAGVLLSYKDMDNNNPKPYYRAVFSKKDGVWTLASKPQIILTKYNTPNVDVEILTSINNINPNPTNIY